MPNAFIRFEPDSPFLPKHGIFIRGNGEPERFRKALNSATRNRRSKVKFDRNSFIPHVSAAFLGLGSECTYTALVDDDPDVHYLYILDTSDAAPMLAVIQARNERVEYAGPFFQFLLHGFKDPPRRGMRPGTNPTLLKRRRLAKLTAASEQERKFYTPQAKWLREQQEQIVLGIGKRKLSKLRRGIVRKLAKRKITPNIGVEPEVMPYYGPPKDSGSDRD